MPESGKRLLCQLRQERGVASVEHIGATMIVIGVAISGGQFVVAAVTYLFGDVGSALGPTHAAVQPSTFTRAPVGNTFIAVGMLIFFGHRLWERLRHSDDPDDED
jgi:Flp pilus assembly pilin Flp